MEKEFVPYDLALALKELGFDKICFRYYNTNLNKKLFIHSGDIPAPLWQQAFDWFRDEYNLTCNIWSGKLSTIFYGYDILNIDTQEFLINNSDIGGGNCDYDTYELARIGSLYKLIEIITRLIEIKTTSQPFNLSLDYSWIDKDNLFIFYKGYFKNDDEIVLPTQLSKDRLIEFMDDGIPYMVPLIVAKVSKFELYDKVIDGDRIHIVDDENYLENLNLSPNDYWLLISDEEDSTELNKFLNGTTH